MVLKKSANMSCVSWWVQNIPNTHDIENRWMPFQRYLFLCLINLSKIIYSRNVKRSGEIFCKTKFPTPAISYASFTIETRKKKQHTQQKITVNRYRAGMCRTGPCMSSTGTVLPKSIQPKQIRWPERNMFYSC